MGNTNPNNFVSRGPIFGVPLETAAERSDPFKLVPYVLRSSFAFLNAKGLDFEGLYRINGSKLQVNHLKEKFDKGERINFLELDKKKPVNPSNIASLELPEPLLTKDLIDEFAKVTEKDTKERVDYCKKLVAKLPPCNKQTLKLFMEHLVKVADNQKVNQMTIDNLLLCITGASKNTPIYLVFLLNYEEIFLGVSKNSESHSRRKEYISYVINTNQDISKTLNLVEQEKKEEKEENKEKKEEVKEEKGVFGTLNDLEQLKLMLKDDDEKFEKNPEKDENEKNNSKDEEEEKKPENMENTQILQLEEDYKAQIEKSILVDEIRRETKNIIESEENVNSKDFTPRTEIEENVKQTIEQTTQ